MINEEYEMELIKKLDNSIDEIEKYIMDVYPVKIIVRHSRYNLMSSSIYDLERHKIDNQKYDNPIYASISFLNVKDYGKWILSGEYKKLEEKYLEIVNQLGYLKGKDASLCITFGCFDEEAMRLQYSMNDKAMKILEEDLKKFKVSIFRSMCFPHFGMGMEVIIFFYKNRQLRKYEKNKMLDYIREKFISILDEIGYTKIFIDGVKIEFDTDENVKRHYAGNYYFRSLG